MVPTQDEEILWILDLVRKKQTNCFKGLLASVDIVPEEEVVRFGRKSSVFKKAEEVVILAMNITTDLRQTKQRVSIGLECRTNFYKPHDGRSRYTLIGASSSNNIGWEMNISRAF